MLRNWTVFQNPGRGSVEKFATKILTPGELVLLPRRSEIATVNYLAARFAAKEAAVKALGTGFSNGVTFKDIEVLNHSSGKPFLTLYGVALELSRALGVDQTHVSLTHGRDVAAAVVVLEGTNTISGVINNDRNVSPAYEHGRFRHVRSAPHPG